jgi:hypothetical protein
VVVEKRERKRKKEKSEQRGEENVTCGPKRKKYHGTASDNSEQTPTSINEVKCVTFCGLFLQAAKRERQSGV